MLRSLATEVQVKLGDDGDTVVDQVLEFISQSQASVENVLSRGEQGELGVLLGKLESVGAARVGDVALLLEDVDILGKHVYMKNVIRHHFNETRKNVTSDVLVMNSD